MVFFDFFNRQPVYVRNPYADSYYNNMEQIEVMWSVIQNLRAFNGDQAYQLEALCRQNITEYLKLSQFDKNHDIEPPHHAPCCVRLAMLYEKQGRYEEGINLCADSIKAGAYADGSKGQMYGRLARLIRKSGLNVSDDIKMLTMR